MGREVRRVPKDWQHPKDKSGRYIPMYDESFRAAAAKWKAGFLAWKPEEHEGKEYWEWHCDPPDRETHRPDWPEGSETHFQMYETVSEGTPISPPMESPEALARWLADNKADSGCGGTATYKQWLRVCRGGYAPSMVIIPGRGMMSGVEGLGQ